MCRTREHRAKEAHWCTEVGAGGPVSHPSSILSPRLCLSGLSVIHGVLARDFYCRVDHYGLQPNRRRRKRVLELTDLYRVELF